jgi:hypothetical protein
MKKIVLTFGLLSGAVSAVLMSAMVPFVDRIGFDWGTVLGYTIMVLSFLFVFFGIRSYRENVGGGYITFGKGLAVGFLIMLISCVIYVVAWEIVYFNFLPDFLDKYGAYVIDTARKSGASAEEITRQVDQMKYFQDLYKNPLWVAAFTFIEPLPVGIPMTLLSAVILRRRRKEEANSPNQLEHSAA